MNGELIEEEKAVVPLMTHCLHYGTGVFEGIRIYQTPKGRAIGTGKTGPITKRLQKAFFDAARGSDPKHCEWLDYVD